MAGTPKSFVLLRSLSTYSTNVNPPLIENEIHGLYQVVLCIIWFIYSYTLTHRSFQEECYLLGTIFEREEQITASEKSSSSQLRTFSKLGHFTAPGYRVLLRVSEVQRGK